MENVILAAIYLQYARFSEITKLNISNRSSNDNYSDHGQALTKFSIPEMLPVKDDPNRFT